MITRQTYGMLTPWENLPVLAAPVHAGRIYADSNSALRRDHTSPPSPHTHVDSNKKSCQILPLHCHLRRTFRLKNWLDEVVQIYNLQCACTSWPSFFWKQDLGNCSLCRWGSSGEHRQSILREEFYGESWQPSRLCGTRLKRILQNSSYAFSPWHFLWLSL